MPWKDLITSRLKECNLVSANLNTTEQLDKAKSLPRPEIDSVQTDTVVDVQQECLNFKLCLFIFCLTDIAQKRSINPAAS